MTTIINIIKKVINLGLMGKKLRQIKIRLVTNFMIFMITEQTGGI